MSVTFILVGFLKSFSNGKELMVLEGKEGQNLAAVCREIGLPVDIISLFFVNGKLENKEYILQSGDEVKLVGLAAGG